MPKEVKPLNKQIEEMECTAKDSNCRRCKGKEEKLNCDFAEVFVEDVLSDLKTAVEELEKEIDDSSWYIDEPNDVEVITIEKLKDIINKHLWSDKSGNNWKIGDKVCSPNEYGEITAITERSYIVLWEYSGETAISKKEFEETFKKSG